MTRRPTARLAPLGWGLALGLVASTAPATAQEAVGKPNLGPGVAAPGAPASEGNPGVPAAGHSVHGESFDDGPRRRGALLLGMGAVDFPVTTTVDEARKFINQGVAQLHSFYYFEAERSFRTAAQLDPACPMAYWGLAMSNTNNPRRAKGFLKEAHKRAGARPLSRRETLYLDALDARYKEGVASREANRAYLQGYEAIVQEFPDDLDARAWMAMVAWENANTDGIGSRQAVDMALGSILSQAPAHPGALHYRIHLWDHQKPERADGAARLYGPSAPGIAHAWHMPGHTFTERKQYARAAFQQEASARVDHAAMLRDRIMPGEIHNYAHNNQWLATSLGHVGRARDAVVVARNLVEEPRDPQTNSPSDGGSAQRSGRLRWAETLARFELWGELIAAIDSGRLDWSDQPLERVERPYSLGLAAAGTGNAARLAEQIAALRDLIAKAKDKEKDPAATAAIAPLAELEGYRALASDDVAAAFDHFAKSTRMRPEALARAHLKARNFGLAEAAARSGVSKAPAQVAPQAALVEVLAACGKADATRAAYRDLRPLLAHADADLPVLTRLRPIVASWNDPSLSQPIPADPLLTGLTPLEPLGPLTWAPCRAESLSLLDTEGARWTLADRKGRNTVVFFYLGGKCPHCMTQLQDFGKALGEFAKLDTDLVAVGTDDLAATRDLKHNNAGIRFPMPLLPDPELGSFRTFGAFDDFEGMPLHGTYLVDGAGFVRFQKVGAEPFLDVEFLKGEAARVNRLTRPAAAAQAQAAAPTSAVSDSPAGS